MKTCVTCLEIKEDECFHKRKPTLLRASCKVCISKKNKLNYRETAAKALSQKKEYYANNRETIRKKQAKYYLENKVLFLVNNTKRKKNVKIAMPSWANQFYIKEIYSLARHRSEVLGYEWHVDHIIPLKGKTVCGLHVETNLQVIPAIDNMRKHNKYDD